MTIRSHITVLLDRTGSMDTIRDDVIGGVNAFLAQQQAAFDQRETRLHEEDECGGHGQPGKVDEVGHEVSGSNGA